MKALRAVKGDHWVQPSLADATDVRRSPAKSRKSDGQVDVRCLLRTMIVTVQLALPVHVERWAHCLVDDRPWYRLVRLGEFSIHPVNVDQTP